jgi:hypothetical protein
MIQEIFDELGVFGEGGFAQRVAQDRISGISGRHLVDVGMTLFDEHASDVVFFPRLLAPFDLLKNKDADHPLQRTGAVGIGAVLDQIVDDGESWWTAQMPKSGRDCDVCEDLSELPASKHD